MHNETLPNLNLHNLVLTDRTKSNPTRALILNTVLSKTLFAFCENN
jgi:hypothetical protein